MTESHDEHLDSLLGEALRNDPPSPDMVERIVALTDGPVCDLLDRSGAMDEDAMIERILAATTNRPAVIAHLGWLTTAWRTAAIVSIAASLFAIVWTLSQPVTRGAQFTTIASDLQILSELDISTDSEFEQQLWQLSASLDTLATDDPWAVSTDALVDRAAEPADWFDAPTTQTPAWF